MAREHHLYKTGDKDAPDAIKDRNGEVVLGLCIRCGRGEIELSEPCTSQATEIQSLRAQLDAARDALERAPEPYEYMRKQDFTALPHHMRSFIDAHRNWLNTAREAHTALAAQEKM